LIVRSAPFHALTRCALVGLSCLWLVAGCGKFQQARECGAFVKTVNAWLTRPAESSSAGAGAASDAKRIAEESRRTAQNYEQLSQSLARLYVQSEDLAPRAQRYEDIANSAARALREVADALDRGDLEKARQKRVEFDTVAQREAPLVKEINGLCR
jgi:hypothetical protein